MPASNGTSRSVRVITVGRTALEPVLRAEDNVELVRVRSSLEAIGEVGAPNAHAGSTVVLIGEGIEAPGWTAAAAEGVRMVDSTARILAEIACDPASIDHRINASADGILDTLLKPSNGSTKTLVVDGAGLATEPTIIRPNPFEGVPAGPPRTIDIPESDPISLALGALVRGDDIVATLIASMRHDPAAQGVVFEAISQIRGPGPNGHVFAEVSHRGVAFGRVSGPAKSEAAVEDWARRLTLAHVVAAQHRQLRDAAFTDPLTGAGNRRFFDRFLERAIAEAREARREVTILVFDIDNFKHYNDAYGHAAGDEILVETVRVLRAITRPTDQVCRIGGDEFVVIFHEPEGPRIPGSRPPRDISGLAMRFQKQICAHKFPKLGNEARAGLTISGGLATFPWDGDGADALLAKADALALESKAAGKNTILLGPGAERVCQVIGRSEPDSDT